MFKHTRWPKLGKRDWNWIQNASTPLQQGCSCDVKSCFKGKKRPHLSVGPTNLVLGRAGSCFDINWLSLYTKKKKIKETRQGPMGCLHCHVCIAMSALPCQNSCRIMNKALVLILGMIQKENRMSPWQVLRLKREKVWRLSVFAHASIYENISFFSSPMSRVDVSGMYP